MPRLHFVVTGRVQGVAFRHYTCEAAARFGIAGFVRNRADGAVEGEAEADDGALAQFVRWLHEGSPWADVKSVETEPVAALGTEKVFVVRR